MNIQIAQLDRTLPDGCVTTIHWTATQTDGDFTASAYGSLGVPAKDPSDPSFIAYEDLTEEQVKQWCIETMGEEQVTALQTNLNNQIEAQKHPVTASGLPWPDENYSLTIEEIHHE
jgi:hypothetical protein